MYLLKINFIKIMSGLHLQLPNLQFPKINISDVDLGIFFLEIYVVSLILLFFVVRIFRGYSKTTKWRARLAFTQIFTIMAFIFTFIGILITDIKIFYHLIVLSINIIVTICTKLGPTSLPFLGKVSWDIILNADLGLSDLVVDGAVRVLVANVLGFCSLFYIIDLVRRNGDIYIFFTVKSLNFKDFVIINMGLVNLLPFMSRTSTLNHNNRTLFENILGHCWFDSYNYRGILYNFCMHLRVDFLFCEDVIELYIRHEMSYYFFSMFSPYTIEYGMDGTQIKHWLVPETREEKPNAPYLSIHPDQLSARYLATYLSNLDRSES